ncbi:hypothetical protein EYF80_035378 [Liparis tanakae]|uniref:Uncharacterized protein n=1 Tax=Liparis tanakae TaxID=230148 RepID=A0A4Z2GM55_9TELE|nr:hypothetical protein EYF80_035378 [Liparis tanakae]
MAHIKMVNFSKPHGNYSTTSHEFGEQHVDIRQRSAYNRPMKSTAPQKKSTRKDILHGDWDLLSRT